MKKRRNPYEVWRARTRNPRCKRCGGRCVPILGFFHGTDIRNVQCVDCGETRVIGTLPPPSWNHNPRDAKGRFRKTEHKEKFLMPIKPVYIGELSISTSGQAIFLSVPKYPLFSRAQKRCEEILGLEDDA